jgi:hypothetical protein
MNVRRVINGPKFANKIELLPWQRHDVDRAQALVLRVHGTQRTFILLDGLVGTCGDHEDIAEAARLLEIVHVPGVQETECAAS